MPELPEVQTTVNGINETVKGLKIVDVWTSYQSDYYKNKESIKCPKYFKFFKENIIDTKIKDSERKAKNILINLDNGKTVLIHMKMTGHLMYGKYEQDTKNTKDPWYPHKDENPALKDPFNRHIRLVFSLSNKKHLVLSDTRKFAKIVLIDTKNIEHNPHISHLGPEPLDKSTDFKIFKNQVLKKPEGNIKTVLMDQTLLSGVGNIYSDEALWLSKIHPESKPKKIPEDKMKVLFNSTREVLSRGIDFGGDSMSDYRNIHGEKGNFQNQHNAYRKTGQKCSYKGCKGVIVRKVINGRSGHFCDKHQILYR